MFNFEDEYRGYKKRMLIENKCIEYVKEFKDYKISIMLIKEEKVENSYIVTCRKLSIDNYFDEKFNKFSREKFENYEESLKRFKKLIESNSILMLFEGKHI